MATRDDSRVARHLYGGKIDRAHSLEEDALLDEFFAYLKDIGVWEELEQFRPQKVKRVLVPFIRFLLLYMLQILFSIESTNALPDLLLTDQAAMKLIGFNAYQIKNGVCKRGEYKRTNTDREPVNRGPIAPETIPDNMAKPTMDEILGLFNSSIRKLAKWGAFPEEVSLTADATDMETTEKFDGCGKAIRKKRVTDKTGQEKIIEVVVYGWKLIVLMEQTTKIPVAATVVKIQKHESSYLLGLVEQAKQNLKGYAWIDEVLIDRGFLDGEDLYKLSQMGIHFVILGKEGMRVVKEARELAAQATQGKEEVGLHVAKEGEGRKEVEVVGIEGLRCYDQYGPPGHGDKKYRNDFKPNLINGGVVRKWAGRDYGPGGKRVYLTNMKVNRPLKIYHTYNNRSTIENSLNKETKQSWNLEDAPKKCEESVVNHGIYTLFVFGLVKGFHLWKEDQEAKELGGKRWRRRLIKQNRDQVIIFSKGNYGIFEINEALILAGARERDSPLKGREEIMKKYRNL